MPSNSQKFDINPRRIIITSPNWDTLGVLFDTRSGDFWVVSKEIHTAFQATGDCAVVDKLRELPETVKENLMAHGIIQLSSTIDLASHPCQ